MKSLRSKMKLADVVQHRKLQLQEKAMLKAQDAEIDRAYDEQVLEAVFQAEQMEEQQQRMAQEKQKALARIQMQQLEEFKQRYIAQLREVRLLPLVYMVWTWTHAFDDDI